MRLLDLFCGAGGAAMGYHQAGFTDIVGVDINPQPEYPFEFVQANAMEAATMFDFDDFDLVHASPPCQRYSTATLNPDDWPDLVDATRAMLTDDRHGANAWVIENVIGAPIRPDLLLCGSMFGLQVQRHRLFELSWHVWNPPVCRHEWDTSHGRPWTITGDLHGPEQVFPHSAKPSKHDAAYLMGMDWVTDHHSVVEAIPPAYTKFIGTNFVESPYNVHHVT